MLLIHLPNYSTAEVRASLRALYLNSDASPFKSLLGVIDNPKKENELSSCSDSVFLAVAQPSKESSSDAFKSDLDNQGWSKESNLNDKKLVDENNEPEIRDPLKQNFQWHCELCGDKFLEQNVLVVHMKKCRSRSERRLKKKSKEERYQIKKERRKTYSKRRTVCELCSKRVTIVYLKQHLKICEKSNFMTKHDFNCNECALGKYKSKESLERHVFKCHSGLVYKCDFCDFTSSTPQAKRLHLASMHLAKTLKCDHCDKMFSKEYRLRAHNRIAHENVKNKQCPHCDEAFKDHRAFEAHVNRHTDNRPYGCETCGKTYLAKGQLAVHAKCHTLPKLCEQCDLRFGRADALKKHIRLVHEQRQVSCRHGCGWACFFICLCICVCICICRWSVDMAVAGLAGKRGAEEGTRKPAGLF